MVDSTPACSPASQLLQRFASARPALLPSLLLCDFGALADEIARLEAAQVPALHLDVMDGHFVPNLTYGLTIVEAVRRLTSLPLDVHLMIANPVQYVEQYRQAGADLITVHFEATPRPQELLAQVRRTGAVVGLALNPPTPLEPLLPLLPDCDVVLVMSVMPGFGGQNFDPAALDKLRRLRPHLAPHQLLEIDGGINQATIASAAAAGADLLVAGSAIFRHADYRRQVARLTELARGQATATAAASAP